MSPAETCRLPTPPPPGRPPGPKGEGGLDDATGASGAAGGASMKQTSKSFDLAAIDAAEKADKSGFDGGCRPAGRGAGGGERVPSAACGPRVRQLDRGRATPRLGQRRSHPSPAEAPRGPASRPRAPPRCAAPAMPRRRLQHQHGGHQEANGRAARPDQGRVQRAGQDVWHGREEVGGAPWPGTSRLRVQAAGLQPAVMARPRVTVINWINPSGAAGAWECRLEEAASRVSTPRGSLWAPPVAVRRDRAAVVLGGAPVGRFAATAPRAVALSDGQQEGVAAAARRVVLCWRMLRQRSARSTPLAAPGEPPAACRPSWGELFWHTIYSIH
jgi:hypothetical protein